MMKRCKTIGTWAALKYLGDWGKWGHGENGVRLDFPGSLSCLVGFYGKVESDPIYTQPAGYCQFGRRAGLCAGHPSRRWSVWKWVGRNGLVEEKSSRFEESE